MKQKISLTPSTDTIHVDEVRVEDGVYGKEGARMEFLFPNKMGGISSQSAKHYSTSLVLNSCNSLLSVIQALSDWTFYHIPTGLRIVTEKPLGVEDLKNWDFVGFVIGGIKFFIIPVGNGNFSAINANLSMTWNNYHNNILLCIPNDCDELYRFTTAKELHKWLGEDEG